MSGDCGAGWTGCYPGKSDGEGGQWGTVGAWWGDSAPWGGSGFPSGQYWTGRHGDNPGEHDEPGDDPAAVYWQGSGTVWFYFDGYHAFSGDDNH